jgi:hypothetical protein
MMAHSRFQIIKETINIPSYVDWNRGFMYYATTNGLFRQGLALPTEAPRSLRVHTNTRYTRWDHHDMGGGG